MEKRMLNFGARGPPVGVRVTAASFGNLAYEPADVNQRGVRHLDNGRLVGTAAELNRAGSQK
jgi:hypothetical protein